MPALVGTNRATQVSPLQERCQAIPGFMTTDSPRPAVGIPDVDHRAQDIVPGLLLHHGPIGEHAAVPADVLESTGRLARFIAHPEAGVVDDVEAAVWVVHCAVAASLVVRAGAEDGAVVLGH